MSKLQGKPFIEQVVSTLSDEQKSAFITLLNGTSAPVFRSLINPNSYIGETDLNKVSHIILETYNKTYTGYLVYNTSYCVLIGYQLNSQELSMLDIDIANKTYRLIKQPLSILELRVVLNGTGSGGSGTEVVINPEGAASVEIKKLQVGNEIGSIPEPAIIISKTATDDEFEVSADEFVSAANNDNVILSLRIDNNYYILNKSTLDSNGVQFSNDKYIAYFNRDGANYSGVVEEIPSGGGSSIDSDVLVELEMNYSSTDYANRTDYATPITIQEFVANCEAGTYTNAGIIARISNMLSETTMRIILIGVNHDTLAYNDTEKAKTTWQFLDMPEHNVRLGLSFNLLDWTSGSGRAILNSYLDGTNDSALSLYPSNMDGLISAQGLLKVCEMVFESMPYTIKHHIKTVRRYYYRKRNTMSVGASGGAESNSGEMCQLASNVFHLAGTDLGTSGQSGEGSGTKYAYFASSANRVRFYNGSASGYWTASPSASNSYSWYIINNNGNNSNYITINFYGVAPAFCI